MSFLIAVHVNEGMVLASDRRTTYSHTQRNGNSIIQQIGIHTTDSTDKTFICPNGAGISTCGDASLLGKPITGFIQDMIRTKIDSQCAIDSMPKIIIDYFKELPTIPDAKFIIAGYNSSESGKYQRLYKIQLKDETIEQIETASQGATWDGESLTLTRLIQNIAIKKNGNEYIDLPAEPILWEYFTLQDAVDFARYAVETTIQTMRFKNVVETVGGSVDILVITPDKTEWLQKETIK